VQNARCRVRALHHGNTTDVEYVIKGFEAALVLDGPFDFITYW